MAPEDLMLYLLYAAS